MLGEAKADDDPGQCRVVGRGSRDARHGTQMSRNGERIPYPYRDREMARTFQ